MKTIINKFMKTILVATFVFGGVAFADASFVNDPSTQGNGITSIGFGYSDANDNNSISANIPSVGDTRDFYVFIDYQNATSSTLNDVRARLTYSGSNSVSFNGSLSASNGGSASDSATLTGLPSNYELTFVSATKVNTHGSYCGSQYEYNTSISGLTSSNGALIGSLDTVGESSTNGYTGACSQGHVVAKFRIENTTPGGSETVADVNTLAASSVTTSSAHLNGDMISGGTADQYWFVYSATDNTPECSLSSDDIIVYASSIGSGPNPSFSLTQSGLNANTTYYYQACITVDGQVYGGRVKQFTTSNNGGTNDGDPEADTQTESDVTTTSATLKGRIKMNNVNNGIVFYVYGQDQSSIDSADTDYHSYDEANNNGNGDDFQVVLVNNNNDEDGWITFSKNVTNLDTNEMYYYQICVEHAASGSDELVCGGIESFKTTGGNDGDGAQIETDPYKDVGTTYANLCGDLIDNGGDSSVRTNIEVRPASGGSWDGSPFRQRGEGAYCVEVTGLTPNVRYQYRACTDDGDCGDVRTFVTNGGGQVYPLNVNTLAPSSVGTTSAVLNGKYQGSSLESTKMWFEWGTTQSLGKKKQVFTRTATGGNFSDSFTGLRSCTTYYYRAVAQNSTGIEYGNIYSLTTSCVINTGGTTVVTQQPKVVVVEEVEKQVIDLDSLGLGLSLLRLDIDDEQDVLFRDGMVEYVVRWENISTIDLDTIDLKITIPAEVTVTGTTKGRYDADENVVLYTIDRLDRGEEGSLTITGVVSKGSLGDVVTAEATAAYNNPINDAQENATDYDIDDFVLNTNYGSASVFGLSNITFLGWLTILLGLLIIFLIARWLYLEREELRAQAYANGYRPALYQDPRGGYDRQVIGSGYDQSRPVVETPHYDQGPDDQYQPYRPNRG